MRRGTAGRGTQGATEGTPPPRMRDHPEGPLLAAAALPGLTRRLRQRRLERVKVVHAVPAAVAQGGLQHAIQPPFCRPETLGGALHRQPGGGEGGGWPLASQHAQHACKALAPAGGRTDRQTWAGLQTTDGRGGTLRRPAGLILCRLNPAPAACAGLLPRAPLPWLPTPKRRSPATHALPGIASLAARAQARRALPPPPPPPAHPRRSAVPAMPLPP